MVARVLFPVLTYRENASTPPPPGDHQGPPFPASSALAPTDHPACFLASRLRLMPGGRPQGSPCDIAHSLSILSNEAAQEARAFRQRVKNTLMNLEHFVQLTCLASKLGNILNVTRIVHYV